MRVALIRAATVLLIVVLCGAPCKAEDMTFRLFDWLTGNDADLHAQLTRVFKLDPSRFPTLTAHPDGGLRLENPGGAPSAIAWSPLELKETGHYTLRFESRGGDGELEHHRASASFGSARLDFETTTEWSAHALTMRLTGPVGPSSISFALRGRKGSLEIRQVDVLRVPFDARVESINGALRLQVVGRPPTETRIIWQSGESSGGLPLTGLTWEHKEGVASALLATPPGDFYDWTLVAGEPARPVLVGNRLRLTAPPAMSRGPMPYSVSIRGDGAVIVGDHPFLPLGLYLHEASVEAIELAARAGLNLVLLPPGEETDKLVRLARDRGMQVIIETTIPAQPQGVERAVAEILSRHASLPVMAWTAVDEPDLKPDYGPILTRIQTAITSNDGRPLYQANHTPQSFWSAGAACDILAVDPYPLSAIPRPLTTVGAWIDEARAAVGAGHSVWYVGQAFVEAPFWPHAPTPQQLRAMTWIALNHGARGIVYYALHEILDPASPDHQWDLRRSPLWQEITRETSELRGLEPFLVHGEGPRHITAGGSIDAALWDNPAGGVLVSLVNTSDREADALLAVSVSGLRDVRVLPDGPTVRMSAGAIALRLPPYGVLLLQGAKCPPASHLSGNSRSRL